MRIAIDWQKRVREALTILAIGTFLAIIKPYNATAGLPFWQSWLYWTGTTAIGGIIGVVSITWITQRMANQPAVLVWLVVSTSVAVLLTPVISGIHFLLGDSDPISGMPVLFVLVWVISAAITAVVWLIQLAQGARATQTGEGEPLQNNEQTVRTFMSRLPLPYRNAELWAISSEDHYLRVHTSAGEHLFLERLATAVHQLNGAKGLQTHRSWWVAEGGVKEAKSQNGRITLTLHSGVEAPVSRTFATAVREEGWV